MIAEWFYGLGMAVLYPVTIALIAGASEFGNWFGRRSRQSMGSEVGTLTGAALGLLALLLAFSFSIAVSRYNSRRAVVLDEANAIGSTANFALMLPQPAQPPILNLLRDYTAVRIGLGIPYDPAKLERDIEKSADLLKSALAAGHRGDSGGTAVPARLPLRRFVERGEQYRRKTACCIALSRSGRCHGRADCGRDGGDGLHRLPRRPWRRRAAHSGPFDVSNRQRSDHADYRS